MNQFWLSLYNSFFPVKFYIADKRGRIISTYPVLEFHGLDRLINTGYSQ